MSAESGATPEAWRALAEAAIERLVARHWRNDVVASKAPEDVRDGAKGRVPDEEFERAWDAFEAELLTAEPFTVLVARAQLSVDEAAVLAVAIAVELDERLQHLVIHLHGDPARARLELGDLGGLLGDEHPGVACLGADEGPRRAAFVSLLGDGPWSRQVVAVHPSVLWALQGDSAADPDLPVGAAVYPVAAFGDASNGGRPVKRHTSLLVVGADGVRRRQTAARWVEAERVLVSEVPTDDVTWAATVRDATLLGAAVVLQMDAPLTGMGRRWIERTTHLAWVLASPLPLPLDELPDRPWVEVDAPDDEPTDEEWVAEFGTGVPRTHRLSAQQLELVGRAHRARDAGLDTAVRRLVSGRLASLARRIEPSRTWDDMVLSTDRRQQLRDIVQRYRHARVVYDEWGFRSTPSRGLVALFSGPSGTGKTLAAEVIAGELGLDLFKLDLSAVVSKYIGETEKNLAELFDAAGTGNLVLFFDEADSLFGKRSEVRDARDRYANQEVSYLLQRLESYDGVVVLATNFEKNIDDAFLRRIHTRVDFAVPEVAERKIIWAQQLPAAAPVADIDLDEVALRFELSGGSIRNVAVHAAFLAAAEQGPITMSCVIRALGSEYRKLGRLIKYEDFGPFLDLLTPRGQ